MYLLNIVVDDVDYSFVCNLCFKGLKNYLNMDESKVMNWFNYYAGIVIWMLFWDSIPIWGGFPVWNNAAWISDGATYLYSEQA